MGPITLFDKSFVQSLSPAEAVWFDHFFFCNIAPPFLIETLADLDKTAKPGRTPDDEVRTIADKSPELGCPGVNTFHRQVFTGSLLGHEVAMTGQVPISSGKQVNVDGKSSMIIQQTPEAEAFQRWQSGQFLELERRVATMWRRALEARPNLDAAMAWIGGLSLKIDKCRSLEDVKRLVDNVVEGNVPTAKLLELAFEIQSIREPMASTIRERLAEKRYIPFRWFAPYAAFVLSVDMVYYIGMKLGLISASDPHTKTDFSYLYYLPFCMVFVSSDKIHKNCAPLFLRPDQRFVWGLDLKAALGEVNSHFLKMSESEREMGLLAIAPRPPKDTGVLIAKLWGELLRPGIMDEKESATGKSKEKSAMAEKRLIAHMNNLVKKAKAAPVEHDATGHSDSMIIERRVRATRGGWRILPKRVSESRPDDV